MLIICNEAAFWLKEAEDAIKKRLKDNGRRVTSLQLQQNTTTLILLTFSLGASGSRASCFAIKTNFSLLFLSARAVQFGASRSLAFVFKWTAIHYNPQRHRVGRRHVQVRSAAAHGALQGATLCSFSVTCNFDYADYPNDEQVNSWLQTPLDKRKQPLFIDVPADLGRLGLRSGQSQSDKRRQFALALDDQLELKSVRSRQQAARRR